MRRASEAIKPTDGCRLHVLRPVTNSEEHTYDGVDWGGERVKEPPCGCSSLASDIGGESRFANCGGNDNVGRRGEAPVPPGDKDWGDGGSGLVIDGLSTGFSLSTDADRKLW